MRVAAAAVLLIFTSLTAQAQSVQFPYDAKVVAEETFARSGGGDSYYPTQRLVRDTVVRVHRHDPGGWYVIDPPSGSFSWISERFVNRISEQDGEVREDNVIACVGSEFGDETSVYQRRLKKGDKVVILGQKTLETSSGTQSMLKIKPPMREFRWVPGSALIPVDPALRQQLNSNPFSVPESAKRPGAIVTPPTAENSTGAATNPVIGPSEALQKLQLQKSEKQQLAEIDQRFREMVLRDASTWDLDTIENDYRQLQSQLTSRQISGAVELRYPAIERYRRRLAQLLDVKQLQSQTEAKDAALVARHSGSLFMPPPVTSTARPMMNTAVARTSPQTREFQSWLTQQDSSAGTPQAPPEQFLAPDPDATLPPESTETPTMFASSSRDVESNTASAAPEMSPPAPANAAPTAPAAPADGVIKPGSPENRFVGAGILQRAPGQANAFVLMTNSGRVLADLKPTAGVRLENYLGQQVGVQGSRWSEKEKRDIIEVNALERVRLR